MNKQINLQVQSNLVWYGLVYLIWWGWGETNIKKNKESGSQLVSYLFRCFVFQLIYFFSLLSSNEEYNLTSKLTQQIKKLINQYSVNKDEGDAREVGVEKLVVGWMNDG
ncbi:transmembrane protein, putative (macronuclear) [Tetrahymena thermophila SB210]|uniref:Transmembrane protein, putative n=1 Tax=Tetrahymena thermophila (strain SB210) TaxID=312017 RepID=W7XKB7_TETTS|nr:transmembrane protein, putative [Tetrahymena thermophila SB210]EWS76371.1 transmembrane protein, putative [Tetrahymena thermophila SB210]|eukprot:XP_012651155.1 transmembrane protein, putative [Tetrahymena thermophila SB210]